MKRALYRVARQQYNQWERKDYRRNPITGDPPNGRRKRRYEAVIGDGAPSGAPHRFGVGAPGGAPTQTGGTGDIRYLGRHMTSSPLVGHRRRRDTPDAGHVPQSRPISNSNTEASAILTSSYYTCCRFPSSLLLSLLQLPGTRVMYRIIQFYLFYLVLTFLLHSHIIIGQ